MEHPHAEEVRPRCARGIIEDQRLFVGKLFKLTLPIYLQRGGTDYQTGICVGRIYNTDTLQGLAKSRLIANQQAAAVEAEQDTFFLVFVRLYSEVMFQRCGHKARHQY